MKANRFYLATFFLIGALVTVTSAQKSKIVQNGVVNGVPYASTDFENINLTNGSLNLNFPLAGLQGRGQAGFTYNLRYSSKQWQTVTNPVYNSGYTPNPTYQNFLGEAPDAGWQDSDFYSINIWNRASTMDWPGGDPCDVSVRWVLLYKWRVEMIFPDGRKVEFRPVGHSDVYPGGSNDDGGYFKVHPDGSESDFGGSPCEIFTSTPSGSRTTYYSSDGTGMRLTFANNEAASLGYTWEVSIPDGSRIIQTTYGGQQIIDRNGNYVEKAMVTLPDGTQLPGWRDQVGRYIARKKNYAAMEDRYYQLGFDGQLLTWKVKWKDVYVLRNYVTTCNTCPSYQRGPVIDTQASMEFRVVESIELPSQLGGLSYAFTYHAKDVDNNELSSGWGEVKSITLPTGAKVNYGYKLSALTTEDEYNEIMPGEIFQRVDQILERVGAVNKKRLDYTETYDGQSTQKQDVWLYGTGRTASSVTTPDGGTSNQYFWNIVDDIQKGGQVYKETKPDGTIIERKWANNLPVGVTFGSPNHMNAYVDLEVITIPDANGNPSLSTIKDFNYDGNQNLISTTEYDWFPSASGFIQRDASGIVVGFSGLTPFRTSAATYYNSTSASQSNAYYHISAPALRNLVESTEVRDGAAVAVSRTEITYDNASTPVNGNPTLVKTWDSHKGGTYQPYSNPLTPANSIPTTMVYDQYGNPTLTTDANQIQTQITYGAVNGFTGLYPTKIISAYQTPIARTSTAVYDFYTGVVTTATDLDNNVSTVTEYDALGRPTKVRSAAGDTTHESWTRTEYNDAARRVIVRSDIESKGDGRKVAIQHFDQLGRVRLARTLEDATTEDPYNETHGIKVETRYQTGNPNSYQLTSNPFRAAYASQATNEPTMGWTRSKAVNTGRHSEVETFSGAALPAPWGSNTNSTGKVQTDIDADRTLVTDQAGKQRISRTNALGQLKDVWEVTASDANTEPITFGALSLHGYKTSYSYDTLNNLTTVNQGVQTRTFAYNSLSRLTAATNPESGTIDYVYDPNGNLTQKIDPRNITTSHTHDALNRVTSRTYINEPSGSDTPDVTYTYDDPAIVNSKGKLTRVSSNVSTTEYVAFDILGRVTRSKQITDGVTYGDDANPMTFAYNLAGALVEQKYPSGRVVKNILENDGDLSMVQSKRNINSGFFSYAKHFTYAASGAVTSMQLGNSRWESTQFNSRLQPTQIALGTVQIGTDKLKLNYSYGDWNGTSIDATKNNGNIVQQIITVVTVGSNAGFTATQKYYYDLLNRIDDSTETVGTTQTWRQDFAYDRYGNRRFNENNTTMPASFTNPAVTNPTISPNNNRINASGYSFDNSGNTTANTNGQTFIYDAENKQIQVSNASGVIGQYWYDGEGKRIKKYVPSTGETTIFVYDAGGKSIAEYSTIVANSTDAKVAYLTNDHLGSPRLNTDANGSITARHDYHPFGEEIYTSQRIAVLGYADDTVRKQFTGYERDDETELDFAQARMYTSRFGRFMTTDPLYIELKRLGDPQQLSLYNYTRNNPLKFRDPTGLDINVEFENEEDKKKFLKELNKSLKGYKVKIVTKDGISSLQIDGKVKNNLTKGESQLKDAITNRDATGTVKIVNGDDNVSLESVAKDKEGNIIKGKNVIDVGDTNKIDKNSGLTMGEIINHGASESYLSAKSTKSANQAFEDAHLEVLNNGVGGLLGFTVLPVPQTGNVRAIFAESILIKNGGYEGAVHYVFEYKTPIPASEVEKQPRPPFTKLIAKPR